MATTTFATLTSSIAFVNEAHVTPDLVQTVRDAFVLARQIIFEDGMENEFWSRLTKVVEIYGSPAVQELERLIMQNAVSPELAAVTLRYLGDMNHIPSYRKRLALLITALGHASPQVRDGAALGIAALDDPLAISPLEEAIKNEPIVDLRQDMQLVLAQLKELV
ncbi:MAG: HEAT repeat domain-containing protein [Caldilineaceae bacterium]